MRVAIIGAGVTGLSTAALVAKRGAETTLIEALPHTGGVAGGIQFAGHRFSPGPQYVWGWEPGGPAHQILQRIDPRIDSIEMPADFERLAVGAGAFEVVTRNIPASLLALPEREREPAFKMAQVLDALGRAGEAISEDARFRASGAQMMGAVARAPISLRDKAWVARLRNVSVQGLATALDVTPRALRLLTHSQGIFAESLQDLSVVLFAAARHHLVPPPRIPRGGFAHVIDQMERAAIAAGVAIRTNTQVVAAHRSRTITQLHLVTTPEEHRWKQDFDAVVWACSPGGVANVLRQSGPEDAKCAAVVARKFAPSHSIRCVCLAGDLDAQSVARLKHRNFSWFSSSDDVEFSSASGATPQSATPQGAAPISAAPVSAAATLNFTSPTLNAGALGPKQVLCVFAPVSTPRKAVVQKTVELLAREGITFTPTATHEILAEDWTATFGAFEGAVYGRRLTSRSMRQSLAAHLPAGWHLAHSGAGIPGFLGCLQMAARTADLLAPTSKRNPRGWQQEPPQKASARPTMGVHS